jgi:hypothetical protein
MKRILCLTALAALAAASVALAAKPKKGATYSGNIVTKAGQLEPISFKVSKNGKKVSHFKLVGGYPLYCQGGGFPNLTGAGSGSVSKKGKFTAKLPVTEKVIKPLGRAGFVIITGKFGAHGTVSGKVKTDITDKSFKTCDGSTGWSAHT